MAEVIQSGADADKSGAMGDTSRNLYLRDAVMTATPEQLQLMLYDGCIRFALQARDAIERKDYETSFERLTRAQHIIVEMRNGLNFEVNPALCQRVAAIYGFLYRNLVDASVHRDISLIDDALKILRMERETWAILVEKVNRARPVASPSTPALATESADVTTPFCTQG